MDKKLKDDIIDILEYFEYGLSDVEAGSDEDQPKLKEIRSILQRMTANEFTEKQSNCNIPVVSNTALDKCPLKTMHNHWKIEQDCKYCPECGGKL